ncbi:hypothetical protein HDV05_007957 [Chytridiales sp. JEL 0842]|nr:hypothetical protein HDV05_007957 [Chytridiales sp. JEL 0842]
MILDTIIKYSQRLSLTPSKLAALLACIAFVRALMRAAFTVTGMPSPTRYPFLGTLLACYWRLRRQQLHKYFEDIVETHGPFVELDFAGITVVALADAAEIKRVCSSDDFISLPTIANNLGRSPILQNVSKDFIQSSMFLIPAGYVWRKHRKGLTPAFGPHHLRRTCELANKFASSLCNNLTSKIKDGKEGQVDLKVCISALTMDIIGQIAFSHDFQTLEKMDDDAPLAPGEVKDSKAIEILIEAGVKRIVIPSFLWGAFGVSNSQIKRYLDQMYKTARDCLAQRKALQSRPESLTRKNTLDALDRLLEANEDGVKTFSDQEVLDEVITFILAGQETTANTLTFAFLLIAQHPQVASKLREEIDNYLQSDEDPTMELLSTRFQYLDNVLKECQRFYPVIPTVLRETVKSTTIGGYKVPKGTTVQINLGAAMRSKRLWGPDAHEFNPERWNGPIPDGAYLAFGSGTHVCIGVKMANIEAKVIMIKLLQRFEFELVADQDLAPRDGITVHLKHLWMKFVPRHGKNANSSVPISCV